MTNIIPMSGKGTRFSDEGYLLPKPLIPVSGKPMIYQVIDSLPKADKWIFVVRQEHIKKYAIDKIIKNKIKHAIIVPEKNPTGQASSCMKAAPYLKPSEEIFIAACDNSFLYDKAKYEKLKKQPDIDAIYWTFTKDKLLSDNPTAWGWIKLEKDKKTILDISIKVPVSKTPFNDHSIVASFYFKRAQDFIDSYKLMKKENYKINNELYVDAMPIFLKKLNKKSVIFDVDLYVGWGKPKDLHLYEYLEFCYFYKKSSLSILWKKYFNKVYGK